jgi:hypothetical protein
VDGQLSLVNTPAAAGDDVAVDLDDLQVIEAPAAAGVVKAPRPGPDLDHVRSSALHGEADR